MLSMKQMSDSEFHKVNGFSLSDQQGIFAILSVFSTSAPKQHLLKAWVFYLHKLLLCTC